MANRHMRRSTLLPIIREIQIKTKIVYHLILSRMEIFFKITSAGKNVEKLEPLCLFTELYTFHGDMEWCKHQMGAPQKVKDRVAIDPSVSFLCIHPKEWKSGIEKASHTLTFIADSFTIAKIWKQPKCPATD